MPCQRKDAAFSQQTSRGKKSYLIIVISGHHHSAHNYRLNLFLTESYPVSSGRCFSISPSHLFLLPAFLLFLTGLLINRGHFHHHNEPVVFSLSSIPPRRSRLHSKTETSHLSLPFLTFLYRRSLSALPPVLVIFRFLPSSFVIILAPKFVVSFLFFSPPSPPSSDGLKSSSLSRFCHLGRWKAEEKKRRLRRLALSRREEQKGRTAQFSFLAELSFAAIARFLTLVKVKLSVCPFSSALAKISPGSLLVLFNSIFSKHETTGELVLAETL